MKTTKEKVKAILTQYADTRDSESLLSYWYYTDYCEMTSQTKLIDFFLRMENKGIPTIQTLMRLSRQIQEQNENLRGKDWEKRQRKVKEVQKDLGYNVGI